MNDMLRVLCGRYGLLLDIGSVLEVAALVESRERSSHRIWRDLRIPFVDLHACLGLPHPARSQQIVVETSADDRHPIFAMDVDQVLDIVATDQSLSAALPFEDARLCHLVKSVWCDPGSSRLWLGLNMNVSEWCFDEGIQELDTHE